MKTLITILVFVVYFPIVCIAGETKVITAAADPWPPFIDTGNPSGGLSMDVVKAAFKTQGYDVKLEFVPWARAEYDVKNGEYDILPDVWMTEERKKALLFSKPYVTNQVKFIANKKDPFEYKGLDSLKGKKIGTIRGYGYSDEFVKSTLFTRDETHDLIQNLKKLTAQRVDLVIEDELVARFRISKEEPGLLNQIKFCKKPFSSNNLYIATGLKNPRHKEIIDAFNNGYEKIKKDGTLAKIFAKYNVNSPMNDEKKLSNTQKNI